ncbi:MAG: hypothetical protein N3B68_07975 [Anaerolineae bacterium]|nr:hypothetical protein [Anaerolineae bacterium]
MKHCLRILLAKSAGKDNANCPSTPISICRAWGNTKVPTPDPPVSLYPDGVLATSR